MISKQIVLGGNLKSDERGIFFEESCVIGESWVKSESDLCILYGLSVVDNERNGIISWIVLI